jgi:hypothetical protein
MEDIDIETDNYLAEQVAQYLTEKQYNKRGL